MLWILCSRCARITTSSNRPPSKAMQRCFGLNFISCSNVFLCMNVAPDDDSTDDDDKC